MVDYGVFNILTPSNDILIVSYDLPEWNKVLKKKSIFFFQGSPLCIFLKIFENVPRVPPLHIFRNFELLELVIVVVVEGEGDGGGEGEGGAGGGGGVEGEVGGGGGGAVGGVEGGEEHSPTCSPERVHTDRHQDCQDWIPRGRVRSRRSFDLT